MAVLIPRRLGPQFSIWPGLPIRASVCLLIVPQAHMAPVLAEDDAGIRDELALAAHVLRVHLVVTARDDEGGDADLRQLLPEVPVLEVARNDELVGTLHSV